MTFDDYPELTRKPKTRALPLAELAGLIASDVPVDGVRIASTLSATGKRRADLDAEVKRIRAGRTWEPNHQILLDESTLGKSA